MRIIKHQVNYCTSPINATTWETTIHPNGPAPLIALFPEGVNLKIATEECEGSHRAEERMKFINRHCSPQKISYHLFISPISF